MDNTPTTIAANPKPNGSAMAPAPASRTHPQAARQSRFALTFANIIGVLMRDAGFRNMRLAELEWLVLPPIMSGQWRLAQSSPSAVTGKEQKSTHVVPVAVALWASVSDEIDKRLSESLEKPLLLSPNEWASGKNIWLVAAAGEPRAMPKFLKTLAEADFKDRQVKLRANGAGGKPVVTTLDVFAASRKG